MSKDGEVERSRKENVLCPCAHTCAYVCGGQKSMLRCTLGFEIDFLTEFGVGGFS